jgi:SAM-dependent methyltransferase
VHDEGAADNVRQVSQPPRGRLPFRDGAFELVVNRHEAFAAAEVARVLRSGGVFLTQQVDHGSFDDYATMLGIPVPNRGLDSWLPLAQEQVESAGLTVRDSGAGIESYRFRDVGALAWYLKAVAPCDATLAHFEIDAYTHRFRALHERIGREPLIARERRFWLRAVKQ